jgi:hypothetical protein
VPQPGPAELLVHVVVSSLNPLDYKLADLNFVGRTPPAVLGFDLAGIVVGRGGAVTRFALGNAVFGMIATQSGRRLGRRRRGRLCAGARLRRRAHAKPAWKLWTADECRAKNEYKEWATATALRFILGRGRDRSQNLLAPWLYRLARLAANRTGTHGSLVP